MSGPARAEDGTLPVAQADLGIGVLFDSIRDAIVVADLASRIVLWNSAAADLFGWTAQEAMGRSLHLIIPERFRAAHDMGMRRYRDTGTGPLVEGRVVLELPALRKDGEEVVVEMSLNPVLSREGRRYVVAILRDVTERVRLAEELEQERTHLRRANDALEDFTFTASHDLKEPLRALEGLLAALDEDHAAAMPAEARYLVGRSRAAARRLRRLLEGLLALSRAREAELILEPVRVADVLRDPTCVSQWEHLVAERTAGIHADVGDVRVLAAREAFCQVMANLVVNAIRHNPKPSPQLWVRAGPAAREGFVDVTVEDDGPGFNPVALEAFERDRTRAGSGGFGLLIAKRTVERMGGAVRLERAPSGSALVRLTLPAP